MSKPPKSPTSKKEKAAIIGAVIDEAILNEIIALSSDEKRPRPLTAKIQSKPKYTDEQIAKINKDLADFQSKSPAQRIIIEQQVHSYSHSVAQEALQAQAAIALSYGAPKDYIDAILAGNHKRGGIEK